MNYKPSAEDVLNNYYKRMSSQRKWEPLSSTQLYLIHTNRYDKPYTNEVKEIIDGYKNYIMEMINNLTLNESNVLNRDFIDDCIIKYIGRDELDEISEHEYFLAFNDLVRDEPLAYNICVNALK